MWILVAALHNKPHHVRPFGAAMMKYGNIFPGGQFWRLTGCAKRGE
jgi:hypothetical protein